MSSAVSSSSGSSHDNIKISFEGAARSWIGRYSEGNVDPKRASDGCVICFNETFNPLEQVIILSCTHVMHEKCFERWEKQTCPMDNLPSARIEKIGFLGYSLIFPARTQKFGLWLQSNEDKINSLLKKAAAEVGLPSTGEVKWGVIIQRVLQDSLNAYGRELPLADMPNQVKALICDGSQSLIENELDQIDFNTDLTEYAAILGNPDQAREKIKFFLQFTSLQIDEEGLHLLTQYLCQLQKGLELKTRGEKLDEEFFKHHIDKYNQLSEAKARHTYLSEISINSLERFERLVPSHPDLQALKEVIEEMVKNRKQAQIKENAQALLLPDRSMFCDPVFMVGLSLVFLAALWEFLWPSTAPLAEARERYHL